MLCLSCFELYSRWVPLNINIKLKPWPLQTIKVRVGCASSECK